MTEAEQEALRLVTDLVDTLARERHDADGHMRRYAECNDGLCSQARRAAALASGETQR